MVAGAAQAMAGFSLSATSTYDVQLALAPSTEVPTIETACGPRPRVRAPSPSNRHDASPPPPPEQPPARWLELSTVAPQGAGFLVSWAGPAGGRPQVPA